MKEQQIQKLTPKQADNLFGQITTLRRLKRLRATGEDPKLAQRITEHLYTQESADRWAISHDM